MYNGMIIKDLIEKKNIRLNSIVDYMGWKSASSLYSILNGNPNIQTLEKLANFLNLSLDEICERNVGSFNVSGDMKVGNNTNNINSIINQANQEKIKALEILLKEKDDRISLLEEMNEYLKR